MNNINIQAGCYIVAVSGGVDSVVLLDMLCQQSDLELIVVHFDHGIRSDSAVDAGFVADLAKKHNLPFETKREELGPNASEDTARNRRYEFLRGLGKKYNAKIITAHHADDVIETIAINLSRGTGWRGLAVMGSDIIRPLVDMTKSEIMDYAQKNNLVWREDSTNIDEKYLRNRFRRRLDAIDEDTKRQLLALWAQQKYLKRLIDGEVSDLVNIGRTYDGGPTYARGMFQDLEKPIAIELLRNITGARLTRPQLGKVLLAINSFLPNKTLQAGGGVDISFTSRNFTVKLIK